MHRSCIAMPFPKIEKFISSNKQIVNDWKSILIKDTIFPSTSNDKELAELKAKLIEKLNDKSISSNELFLLALVVEYADSKEQALRYYDLAIKQGNTEAMFVLAEQHEAGIINPKNFDAAKFLYKLAAENGHGLAQTRLAKLENEELLLKAKLTT